MLLSLGREGGWRRRLVDALAPCAGGLYLDVATGTGLVAREIVSRGTARVVGIDLAAGMLGAHRSGAALVRARAEALPFADATFDGLAFTYLLRYVDDPAATLRELARVVRPGGRVVSLEFAVPRPLPLRAGWWLYTRLALPLLARIAGGEWPRVVRFLRSSIPTFYARHPLAEVETMWRAAGIGATRSDVLGLGAAVVTSGTRVTADRVDRRDATAGRADAGHTSVTAAAAGTELRPAFYALRSGAWRDYVTLLHPPYTLWHLSYVVLGAALAPTLHLERLAGTLLAFFLALGVGVHALDELNGRPLRTRIPDAVLVALAVVGLASAVALGTLAAIVIDASILVFVAVGVLLALAYPLELARGTLHGDLWFALGWGAFPVLTAYWAQSLELSPAAIAAAAFAIALSYAQRTLSTWVRLLRRRASRVTGELVVDGERRTLDAPALITPAESALRWLVLANAAIAGAALLARIAYH